MKLKISEKLQRQIDVNAVTRMIQEEMTERIEARKAEFLAQLEAEGVELTPDEIAEKFLGDRPVIQTQQPKLLVPA